jgi:AP-1 complex subunit mu
MVASAVYITDLKGKVLISRNYRGNISMSAADKFSQRIRSQEDMDVKPVFTVGSITYSYIKYNNVYLLATSRRNVNVTLILLFLYRICDVFKSYFGEITEESIKDNFVIIMNF